MWVWFVIILGVAVAASRRYNAPRTKVAHLKATGIGFVVAFALMLVVRNIATGSSATTPEAYEALMNGFQVLTYGSLVLGAAVTWLYVRRKRGLGPTVMVEVDSSEGVDVAAWTAQYASGSK